MLPPSNADLESIHKYMGNTGYIRKVMNQTKGSLTITQTNVSVNKPTNLIHIIIRKVHDKIFQYLWIQEVHTIIPPHRHGSNLRHVIPKTQISRLHNLPMYMHICIWANRWNHMAPKPMPTVGSAGNSIYSQTCHKGHLYIANHCL